MRAFTHDPLFTGDVPFRPWLLTVASRLALNHVREQRRREHREQHHPPPVPRPDPLEAVLARHLNQELSSGLRGLPSPYRQVLVLRYHDQLSCDEIARIMELPAGTVMSHLYRARLVLRRHLTRAGPLVERAERRKTG